MDFIKSHKHPAMHPSAVTAISLVTGLALALPAAAATPSPDTMSEPQTSSARQLSAIQVHGIANDYKVDRLSSPKFTEPLLDTPQTITVITGDLFRQQGATTLTQALQNSPGVGTFYVGENGSTSTGDEIYMRGFDTSGSIFVDGVRDLGTISRDVFDIEQIEVTKGPDSAEYGRTAPTGAVNMVTKQPTLDNAASGSVAYGSGNQKRVTADWNRAIGSTSAFRLNVMGQKSGVPGRDKIRNNRWGLAPSLAFGLGTATRLYLDYLHVRQSNVPDGGVPTIGLPGYRSPDPTRAFLGSALRVDASNDYGTDQDHDHVSEDMFTAILTHDISPDVSLHDTLRWGRTHQDYLLTSFTATSAHLLTPAPADPSTWTLARSNPNLKDQTNRIVTNQTNLTAHFSTGVIRHDLSAGVEVTRERLATVGLGVLDDSSWPAAGLYHPDASVGGLIYGQTGAYGNGRTTTVAAYLFDTLHFGDHWLINTGARLDHYTTAYDSTVVCGGKHMPACGSLPPGSVVAGVDARKTGTLPNGQLGVIYKPTPDSSIYANVATSEQPPGGDNLSFSSLSNSADNPSLAPEKARTVEVGTKWNIADDELMLTAALYRTTVSNDLEQDPTTLQYYQIGRKRVQGVEITAVGQITRRWSVNAGFTSMNTHVDSGAASSGSSSSAPANDGSGVLAYTPKLAFTSWTTYRLSSGLVIGGGTRYSGAMKRGHDGAIGTPDYAKAYWVFDAMASYPVNRHLSLQLNLYNLFDRWYVAAINKSGYRYVPGTPRSAMLTANIRF